MKRVRMAAVSLGMLASSFTVPAIAAQPVSACSFDYVMSTKTLTATKLADERVYLSIALKGPGTVTAQWGASRTNSVTVNAELGTESAKIGIAVAASYSYSASQSHSFSVPSGKFGKVVLVLPKYRFYNELTWSNCGSTTNTYKTYATRNHYVNGMYTTLETRTTSW